MLQLHIITDAQQTYSLLTPLIISFQLTAGFQHMATTDFLHSSRRLNAYFPYYITASTSRESLIQWYWHIATYSASQNISCYDSYNHIIQCV
jgi:hypothetical protein